MRLINRCSKDSRLARQACDAALAEHVARFGEFGRQKTTSTYTILVEGSKIVVEVANRRASYVATAMTGARRLRRLPGQVM
nr:DUF4060 family protein [uncultured Enterobacter sp.]